MILLDSNILIYAARAEHAPLRRWLAGQECAASLASRIEVLGFHRLTALDKAYFAQVFDALRVLPLTPAIADRAVALRQARKMGLGDAIIAATALEWGCPLATRNLCDFGWIDGLEVIDPLAESSPPP